MNLIKCVEELKFKPNKIIHIGANNCTERHDYYKLGLTDNDVIWIEAIPYIVNKIKRENENIKIFQGLLMDKSGEEVEFNISDNDGQSSSIFDFGYHRILHDWVHYNNKIKLSSLTFTNFIEKNNLNLDGYDTMVLDIQGAELKAFKGMEDKVFENIKFIFMEISVCEVYKGQGVLDDVIVFLKSKGFSLYDMLKPTIAWGDACFVKTSYLTEFFKY